MGALLVAHPFEASVKTTLAKESPVDTARRVQCAPPSLVLTIVPLSPTAQPWLAFRKKTAFKASVPPGS